MKPPFSFLGMLGLLSIGCAGASRSAPPASTKSTAITAATVPVASREAVSGAADGADRTERTDATTDAPPPPIEAPPGELVCRTERLLDGTTELYLRWKGSAADGVLRNVTPSGMRYERKVHAERYHDVLIVDDPGNTDLVVHAALLRDDGGKQLIKIGDDWSTCDK